MVGNSDALSSADQKLFDLVRQLQTGAAKIDDHVTQQFLAFAPSQGAAPSATTSDIPELSVQDVIGPCEYEDDEEITVTEPDGAQEAALTVVTQLLEALQQLSTKPEIAENPQLLSLFQQKKQLLFEGGSIYALSSADQKFFDLVRQLQTGAAKIDDHVTQQFLALAPSQGAAPSATTSDIPELSVSPTEWWLAKARQALRKLRL